MAMTPKKQGGPAGKPKPTLKAKAPSSKRTIIPTGIVRPPKPAPKQKGI